MKMSRQWANFFGILHVSNFGPFGLAALPFPLPVLTTAAPILLAFVVSNWVNYDKSRDLLLKPEVPILSTCATLPPLIYDFIVIGAGSAGMTVATRLANNTKGYSVLLLEAGGEPCIVNGVPVLASYLATQVPNTWTYLSPAQSSCCEGSKNRQVLTTRGKMLGGSSGINFMMYVRGHAEDYNQLANDLNDTQWSYENVLPYFKKSENYNGYWPFNSTYHGSGGMLNVATYDLQPELQQFLSAAEEPGFTLGDYNGANQTVFSPVDMTTKGGWRESVYRAFYKDNPNKLNNLYIKKYAFVTKINFNASKTAESVTYDRHGCSRTVRARQEIILSAGCLNSPQILMLSGIGPRSHLEEKGISVIQDLPVGQNVQDHCYTFLGPFLNFEKEVAPKSPLSYFGNGSGFFKSPQAVPAYNDIQVVHCSVALFQEFPALLSSITNFNATIMENWLFPQYLNMESSLVAIILGRPKSTGTITLNSTNPYDTPIVDPKYLSNPDDLQAILYAIKLVVRMYENTTALNTTLLAPTPFPPCANHTFKSDEYYICFIKSAASSLYHHVGSCAMGRVVDSYLKVMGVNGLRVIDASVIPRTPNGNTNAPTIMVA